MSGDTGCKVDRVCERWDLTMGDELRERWRGGESLRELETVFNEAVLRAALQSADADVIDGEAANLYRLLTDDSVSAGQRVDAEARLRRAGLDPTAVTDDFVSYGTVRTHLNECLGIETTRDTRLDPDEGRTTVLKLLSRTESVTERTIARLTDQGALTIPAPSVTLSLRVACDQCGDEYSFSQLLSRGGCSCGAD
ncbi:rod-determining factor RdfA [Halorientalis marina]|jgi:hypothetical protein|uniref:rod-determining factor RdfA n=1 Tax=Halorientalis marina TaxID=2931976 RepID=UPI0035628A1E